jgi:hypothetical protein
MVNPSRSFDFSFWEYDDRWMDGSVILVLHSIPTMLHSMLDREINSIHMHEPATAPSAGKMLLTMYVMCPAAMMRFFIQQYDHKLKSAKTRKRETKNQDRCPPPHQHWPSPSRST